MATVKQFVDVLKFTFHYVSIKSTERPILTAEVVDLHSTMYLFNPIMLAIVLATSSFTFHYVSIKSSLPYSSDMSKYVFTFHYVSIKSIFTVKAMTAFLKFTFHYVSIKSAVRSVRTQQ